uniref:Uncharacterized protein n=1 Tax=Setaria digitata TaxID=48799 RepID=A0A915PV64_9BILA
MSPAYLIGNADTNLRPLLKKIAIADGNPNCHRDVRDGTDRNGHPAVDAFHGEVIFAK